MSNLDIQTPRWGLPYLSPKRYKGLAGGRGAGKSHFFAELLVEMHVMNRDFNSVCVREIQKSLKFSAKKLIEDKILEFNVSHLFNVTLTEIRRKEGKGIIIFQGMQDHTADSIKSLEGFNCCWVEEAQSISSRSLELLLPTIRTPDSEIWFSWNPNNPEDPIEKLFNKEHGDMIYTHVNFYDNPFCPDEIKKEANRHKKYSPETYDHVWLGVANSGTESAFIKPEWIRACVDAHKKLKQFKYNMGQKVTGFDVADEEECGSDSNATTYLNGSIVKDINEWKDHSDVGESARRVFHFALTNRSTIVFDSVGLGAGAKSEFNRLNKDLGSPVKSIAFIAGAKVSNGENNVSENIDILNKNFFFNLKAQIWWKARQRIHNTYLAITKGKNFDISDLISLSSEIELLDKLISELSRPKIIYDNNSRIMVERKKDMAKRGVKSPNLADSFVMCFYNDYREIYIG